MDGCPVRTRSGFRAVDPHRATDWRLIAFDPTMKLHDARRDVAASNAKSVLHELQRRSWQPPPTIGPTHKIFFIVFLGHGYAI